MVLTLHRRVITSITLAQLPVHCLFYLLVSSSVTTRWLR